MANMIAKMLIMIKTGCIYRLKTKDYFGIACNKYRFSASKTHCITVKMLKVVKKKLQKFATSEDFCLDLLVLQ